MSFIPDPAQLSSALEILLAGIPNTREKVAKVGDGPRLSHAMAMRIGRNAHGEPTFVAETPVFHLGWQDRGHCFGGSTFIDVHRYEIKARFSKRDAERADAIERGEGTGILKSDWILVAKLPYSLGRVAWVRLEGNFTGQKADKAVVDPALIGCAEKLWQWLDALRYDYWETSSALRTAAFRTFEPAPTIIESVRKPRDDASDVALGICTDPWSVLDAIKSSAAYRRLLNEEVPAAQASARWNRHNAQGKGASTIRLNDPRLLEYAPEIIDLSVRQAMAGPDNAPPSDAKLLHKPVFTKARWIFDEHIKRLNERGAKAQLQSPRVIETAAGAEPEPDAALDAPEQLAERLGIAETTARFLAATIDQLTDRDEGMSSARHRRLCDLFIRLDRLGLPETRKLDYLAALLTPLTNKALSTSDWLSHADGLVSGWEG